MELIKIGDDRTVCAKELHRFLRVSTRWDIWVQRRIKEYEFSQGTDFIEIKNDHNEYGELRLSLDTAKELCMVERNDQGRQARKYFIEIEKRWQAQRDAMTPAERLLEQAKWAVEQERKLAALDQRQDKMESKQDKTEAKLMLLGSDSNYRTVRGMCKELGQSIPRDIANSIGRKAAGICRQNGLTIGKVPDERDGEVNSYPIHILKPVIEGWQA